MVVITRIGFAAGCLVSAVIASAFTGHERDVQRPTMLEIEETRDENNELWKQNRELSKRVRELELRVVELIHKQDEE